MRMARSASRMRPASAAATHLRKLTAAGRPARGRAYATETSSRTGPWVMGVLRRGGNAASYARTRSGVAAGRGVVGVAGVVGIHDPRDERVAHHVARLEEG